METKYLSVEDLDAYRHSYELSNCIWKLVIGWAFFQRETLGKQFVRAVDSISANIAEGYGRYSMKDKIRFYHYSLGSVLECKDWNNKCYARSIITQEQYSRIKASLDILPKEINQLIQYTRTKLKH